MRHIDITTWIGDAQVTLSCELYGDAVEKVTPYFKNRKWPKLQRWANEWLDSDEGCDAVADALYDLKAYEEDDYADFIRQQRIDDALMDR